MKRRWRERATNTAVNENTAIATNNDQTIEWKTSGNKRKGGKKFYPHDTPAQ